MKLEHAHPKKYFIRKDGLDALTAEGNLSAGQGQLVCFVQAVLRKTHILMTTAIDKETDVFIQKTLKDSIVITPVHRFCTILDSDVIVVIDADKLVKINH